MSSLLDDFNFINNELSIWTVNDYNNLSVSQQISLACAIDRLGKF